MGNSIQDYLKKINSRLSLFDTISLCFTAIFLIMCALYFAWLFKDKQKPVLYRTGYAAGRPITFESRPFGSKSGATYTYSWCQGSDKIKPENKTYYESAEEAEQSGRRLSRLCEK